MPNASLDGCGIQHRLIGLAVLAHPWNTSQTAMDRRSWSMFPLGLPFGVLSLTNVAPSGGHLDQFAPGPCWRVPIFDPPPWHLESSCPRFAMRRERAGRVSIIKREPQGWNRLQTWELSNVAPFKTLSGWAAET